MNKKVTVENLEQLIEEHKKEKIPYKTYEFDSDSYTLLLCDINQLKSQLEEKDKIIDEAIEFIKDEGLYEEDFKIFNDDINFNELSKLLEILERGKNEK